MSDHDEIHEAMRRATEQDKEDRRRRRMAASTNPVKAARDRRYYLAHRQEILARQRRYRETHREAIAARDRRYRERSKIRGAELRDQLEGVIRKMEEFMTADDKNSNDNPKGN
ncbi:hypothetical protein [Nocardia carnea]|uniref:hypothetical protein n=1 Tax=Nocardia carnea TaxID=37328 RepID=UPI002455D1D3|nr:hypothetical protein [Nocardia carnea]